MSARELLSVYKKMKDRIVTGVDSFESINKLVAKRADAEEKISNIIRDLIPPEDKVQKNDYILQNIIEDLRIESSQHMRMSNELKVLIIQSKTGKLFAKTQDENQKSIEKILLKQYKELKSLIMDMDKANNKVQAETDALKSTPSDRKEAQKKKIQKAKDEAEKRTRLVEEFANKSKADQFPQICNMFSDFDKARLKNLQENIQVYAQMAVRLNDSNRESGNRLYKKMLQFDAEDRSDRFYQSAIDPSAKVGSGANSTDIFAIALADYRSEEVQDLQFSRGDRIKILNQHNSGWWEGEVDNRKGTFPESFVEIEGKPTTKQTVIGSVLLCIRDYKSTKSGEIDVLTGDLIYVDNLIGDVCQGKNLRTNESGSFPLNTLEHRIYNPVTSPAQPPAQTEEAKPQQ